MAARPYEDAGQAYKSALDATESSITLERPDRSAFLVAKLTPMVGRCRSGPERQARLHAAGSRRGVRGRRGIGPLSRFTRASSRFKKGAPVPITRAPHAARQLELNPGAESDHTDGGVAAEVRVQNCR